MAITHTVNVMGRIDELEGIATPELLKQYMLEVYDQPEDEAQGKAQKEFDLFVPMYKPLDLPAGTYMVTGIEGKYYDGYVPGKRLVEGSVGTVDLSKPFDGEVFVPAGTWVEAPDNDAPWPLEVTSNMSAFDLCVAAAASEANGYPHVNHVWFEGIDIDAVARTIQFSMGS